MMIFIRNNTTSSYNVSYKLSVRRIYVIPSARGQLKINFTRVFKVFTNCPSREVTRAILKTLKIQVKFIPNYPKALAITCLPH